MDAAAAGPRRALIMLLALVGLSSCGPALEPGALTVRDARIVVSDSGAVLEAQVEFQLGPALLEALHAGVPIHYEWRAEYLDAGARTGPLARHDGQIEIDYRAFTGWYLVRGLAPTLTEADGAALGSTRGEAIALPDIQATERRLARLRLPLGEAASWPDSTDRLRLRIALDVGALPPTLRLPAYVSPAWQQDSGWFEWRQAPPPPSPTQTPAAATLGPGVRADVDRFRLSWTP